MDPASDLISSCYSKIHFTLHCNAHCNINEDWVISEISLTIIGGSVMEVKMLSDVFLEKTIHAVYALLSRASSEWCIFSTKDKNC